jgi:hypothetical protein
MFLYHILIVFAMGLIQVTRDCLKDSGLDPCLQDLDVYFTDGPEDIRDEFQLNPPWTRDYTRGLLNRQSAHVILGDCFIRRSSYDGFNEKDERFLECGIDGGIWVPRFYVGRAPYFFDTAWGAGDSQEFLSVLKRLPHSDSKYSHVAGAVLQYVHPRKGFFKCAEEIILRKVLARKELEAMLNKAIDRYARAA